MTSGVTKPPTSCHLSVGTSGYSCEEWLNDFCPAHTPAQQMLSFYAQTFSMTELNYIWYVLPQAYAIERMLTLVGPDFKFAAKLTHTMTHEIDPKQWRNQVNLYKRGRWGLDGPSTRFLWIVPKLWLFLGTIFRV